MPIDYVDWNTGLPKESGTYLVTFYNGDRVSVGFCDFIAENPHKILIERGSGYNFQRHFYENVWYAFHQHEWDSDRSYYYVVGNVIAWFPSPVLYTP